MPPKPKTETERQQLRTFIIDAARELFVARGVDAVTMREIAKKIGYSATSIYLHFADKQAVLRAICDTDFLALAQAQTGILQIADPVERMLELGRGYVKFSMSHPNHYRLMFMAAHEPNCKENSSLQQNSAEQDAYFQLQTVVKAVYEAKKFRQELNDVDLIAQTVWAGMHGLCALEITMSQDTWVNWIALSERLAFMQTVLLRGLLRE